jgi:hypothetical protein
MVWRHVQCAPNQPVYFALGAAVRITMVDEKEQSALCAVHESAHGAKQTLSENTDVG